MRSLWLCVAFLLLCTSAQSRDGFDANGRPTVCGLAPRPSVCSDWIVNVKRPDTRTSCCGEADAYQTDGYELDAEGNLWAIFSEDYPPRQGYEEQGFKKGDKILIPPDKMNNARDEGGNPSGHSVTFIITGTKQVICYLGPTGT